MIITIDGPVASGKSTVSRILAHKLGYYYLCSGLLYRALAYLLVNTCGYTEDTIADPRPEDIAFCLDPQRFSYHYNEQEGEAIFFDNHTITPFLKERFIDKMTSIVSVNARVRKAVTAIQHEIACDHNIVTDGRDVGSAVFPHADIKFFVTASVEVRAERWRKDQEKYGNYVSLDQAIVLITDRDNRDKNRDIAPLIVPDDAIVVDTSLLTIQEAVCLMMSYVGG